MASLESLIGDRYNREARVMPALLALAPAVLALFVWLPALRAFGPALVTFVSFFGVLIWLSHLARHCGSDVEQKIFDSKSSFPTTILLQHDDSLMQGDSALREFALNPAQKEAYKGYFSELNPLLTFPHDADEERRDLSAARGRYEQAIEWLREMTRDSKKFPLVLEENIAYGFSRNLRGMRRIALWCGGIGFTGGLFATLYGLLVRNAPPSAEEALALMLLGGYLTLMRRAVTDALVKKAGYTYARQLLSSLHKLHQDSKPKAKVIAGSGGES